MIRALRLAAALAGVALAGLVLARRLRALDREIDRL